MEKETNLQGGSQESANEGQKTFTQEDINRIVQERISREKTKYESDYQKKVADLEARERRLNAVQKLRENNLPDTLVDALNMDSEESFNNSIKIINEMMKGQSGTQENNIPHRKADIIGTIITNGNSSKDVLREAFGLKG